MAVKTQHSHARLPVAILLALGLLLVLLAVATLHLLERGRAGHVAAAQESANRVARAVEASVNRGFVQVDSMLVALPGLLASLNGREGFDAAAASRTLRALNGQNLLFRDILLVDAGGRPIATALPISRRRPLPLPLGSAYVDAGISAAMNPGGLRIGGPVQNPLTGEETLYFARDVTFPTLGLLTALAEVPVSNLGALLAMGGEVPGLRMTLTRTDGTALAAQPVQASPVAVVAQRTLLYPGLTVTAGIAEAAVEAAWRLDRDQLLMVAASLVVLKLGLAGALLMTLRHRDRADAERMRWRQRLESALESMSDGFVMFDGQDRLIISNSPYRGMYEASAPFIKEGATFGEILRGGAARGQYPQLGDGDVEVFIKEMTAWRRAGGKPIERLLPDGRWVLIAEHPTPDGGTVGIRTDITAQKRAMAELAEARDTAQEAARAKGLFLARMSHELRTPLNAVLGFAQLLMHDSRTLLAQREQLRMIHDAGTHLREVVNGLLDLTKIEAGKLELFPRDVALRPLLEACKSLVAPEAARKRVTLTLDLAPETPPGVRADPTRLRQILLNLLANAVKFAPHAGHVALRVQALAEEGLRFEVEDDGPGIPADKRHLLFRDFSQLASESEAAMAGTGLGLSIAAQLTALMGGRIGCESPPGQGATFWVDLPLPAVMAFPPASAPQGALPARSLRLLVADDIAANRIVARAMLESAGHSVRLVSNGAEALAAVQEDTFDVALLDVQMPLMDGLEATRRIRALSGAAGALPVLALTASALAEEVAACAAAGMNGHLAKPIDRGALLTAVLEAAAAHTEPAREPA